VQALHDRQQALVQRCRDAPVCRIGQDRDELADMLGPLATTMPNSAISPRNVLINMVRCFTSISRIL
jgi:hypothetical protein